LSREKRSTANDGRAATGFLAILTGVFFGDFFAVLAAGTR
jgi:hypothetical protein